MAPDGSRVAADVGIAAGAAGEDFNETLALAAEERETLVASPHAGGTQASPAERAERLREQMSERATDGRRASFESVELPTGAPLAVMAAAAIGLAIGLTGGASSMLISVPILGVTYFAVFGTRIETIFATVVTLLASIGAVLANTPISTADQTRSLTVLITVAIAAYTLQSNSRRLMIAERRAAELSLVDALTGLPNRTAFERDLARALPRSGADEHSREVRLDGRPAVAALDLAGFGAIHSRLGHARADLLLAEVAHALRDALGTEGEIYRIGPDEYAAIIRAHHMQHVANVGARCADAVHALDSDDRYADQGVVVEFRFGGAIWEPGMTAADLAAAAIAEQSQFAGAGAAPLVTSAG
jgi:diguanylate cyclase (GGDEF)-like protein